MFDFILEELFRGDRVPSPKDRAAESMHRLNIHASGFLILFRQHHRTMLQNVQNCQQTSERIKRHDHTLKACVRFIGILLVLTLILAFAAILHPIHGKSLRIYWDIYAEIHKEVREDPISIGWVIFLITCAPTALCLVLKSIDEIRIVREANLSIRNFRSKLSLLNPELEGVKRVCEDLRRASWSVLGGAERVNIMTLEKSVLELFVLTEGLPPSASAGSVTQVYAEYSRTLRQLDKMSVLLDVYSGRAILIESDFVD